MDYVYVGIGLFMIGAIYRAVSSALLYKEYKSRLRNGIQTAEYRHKLSVQKFIGLGIMLAGVLEILIFSVAVK